MIKFNIIHDDKVRLHYGLRACMFEKAITAVQSGTSFGCMTPLYLQTMNSSHILPPFSTFQKSKKTLFSLAQCARFQRVFISQLQHEQIIFINSCCLPYTISNPRLLLVWFQNGGFFRYNSLWDLILTYHFRRGTSPWYHISIKYI